MNVLKVRRGRSPNCSAVGSVVGIAIVSAVVGATIVNAWAERFVRWRGGRGGPSGATGPLAESASGRGTATPVHTSTQADTSTDAPRARLGHASNDTPRARLRHESFGSILAWPDPAALLYLDAAGTEAALARGTRVIGGQPAPAGALSAPTEVHIAVTERCPVACTGCYLDAGPDRDRPDPTHAELRAALREAADLGVFEVAFGGGEAVLRDDLLDLAAEARALDLVPNLTTSGFGVTPQRARRMAELFGQVNVSLDGLPGTYEAVRGWDGAAVGLNALDVLRDAGVRTGVNTVLSRRNIDHLDTLADALVAHGVSEWQWVRFKPTGRGADVYDANALRPEQAERLLPLALAIEARTGLVLRTDCALVPFLASHDPPVELMERLGVSGCVGGESLWTRGATGAWTPCSFASDPELESDDRGAMADLWADSPTLTRWRDYATAAPEPCSSCTYRSVCRGGCRVVARHVGGSPWAPDPECPRVRAHG